MLIHDESILITFLPEFTRSWFIDETQHRRPVRKPRLTSNRRVFSRKWHTVTIIMNSTANDGAIKKPHDEFFECHKLKINDRVDNVQQMHFKTLNLIWILRNENKLNVMVSFGLLGSGMIRIKFLIKVKLAQATKTCRWLWLKIALRARPVVRRGVSRGTAASRHTDSFRRERLQAPTRRKYSLKITVLCLSFGEQATRRAIWAYWP